MDTLIVSAFGNPKNFEGDKYFLHYKICKAVEYGIPQKRERVVVFGMLNQDFNIDEVFSKAKDKVRCLDNHFFDEVNLFDAISDLPNPTAGEDAILGNPKSNYQEKLRNGQVTAVKNHFASKHNAVAIERMKKIHSGENWKVLDESIHSVHSGAYGRLDWYKPTMTITTRFDTPAGGRFIHPEDNRTITPREAARIQSFPDSFEFIGNKTLVCRQIGNAVPPKLAYFLAHVVKILLENETE